jgi:hypothetical protein
LGRERCVFVHPQNSFNDLILNCCIGGCWFTPTMEVRVKKKLRTKKMINGRQPKKLTGVECFLM